MSEEALVAVGTFLNHIEAELAQGALEASGIESVIAADDTAGLRPHLSLFGVRLLVRAVDADQARRILHVSA